MRPICSVCTVPPLQPPVDVNSNVAYKFLVDSNEAGHLIGSKGNFARALCLRACWVERIRLRKAALHGHFKNLAIIMV